MHGSMSFYICIQPYNYYYLGSHFAGSILFGSGKTLSILWNDWILKLSHKPMAMRVAPAGNSNKSILREPHRHHQCHPLTRCPPQQVQTQLAERLADTGRERRHSAEDGEPIFGVGHGSHRHLCKQWKYRVSKRC